MEKPAPTEHAIHELLRRRWSPRAFSEKPVDAAVLTRLFEAARWAPSSYNEQPWAFIYATKDQPEDYRRLLDCLIPFNQSWAQQAPVLVVTVARLNFAKNNSPNRHAYHDVGLAVSDLVAQATAEGLFCHQMAGIDYEKARTDLQIPAGFDPVTAIAIGHPGDPATLADQLRARETEPRVRKALSEIVHRGGFGKPAGLGN